MQMRRLVPIIASTVLDQIRASNSVFVLFISLEYACSHDTILFDPARQSVACSFVRQLFLQFPFFFFFSLDPLSLVSLSDSSMPTDSNASPLSSSSSPSTVTTVVTPTMSSGSSLTMASITTSISSASHSRPPSPPSSLAKELTKLKSFLSTLYYFGSDVSSETGERVRGLILALVVSLIEHR